MEWLIYLLLLAVAFFAMDAGYTFFAFLVFIGMVLLLATRAQPKTAVPRTVFEGDRPIIIEAGHGDSDSGPGRMGRMNFIQISHKKNVPYWVYFNANLGMTLDNVGRGIADLFSGPSIREKGSKKEGGNGGGHGGGGGH